MKKNFNHGINNLRFGSEIEHRLDNGNILFNILIIVILLFLKVFSYKVKIKICDIRFIILNKNKNGLKKISTINISNLEWSKEQLEMKSQILKGDYIENHRPIGITDGKSFTTFETTKDNICINGNHRLSVLKQVKEPNYEIVVRKLWLVNFNIIKRLLKYLNPEINKYLKKQK